MPYLLVFFLARANANVWFIGETSIGKVKLASALMSMIKLGVFVAEIDFNVAELFTKLTTIAMCHAHFFLHVRWYLQCGWAILMKLDASSM